MAGAVVQVTQTAVAAAASSIASGVLASNVTAGNFLWVVVSQDVASTVTITKNSGTATIGAVTDQGSIVEAGVLDEMTHFTIPITGTGTIDILATFGASISQRCIAVVEVSGVSAVDGTDEQTDVGNNPSPTCTVNVTTQPAFGLMCMVNYQGAAATVGSGWTLQQDNFWTSVIGEGIIQKKAISATGNVTGNYVNTALDRNNVAMVVFTEGAAGVTVSDFDSDENVYDTQVGAIITGAGFGASQGAGKVELWSDSGGTTKVGQTVTSWSATSIQITVVKSTLSLGTVYLVVTDNGALANTPMAVTLSAIPPPGPPLRITSSAMRNN